MTTFGDPHPQLAGVHEAVRDLQAQGRRAALGHALPAAGLQAGHAAADVRVGVSRGVHERRRGQPGQRIAEPLHCTVGGASHLLLLTQGYAVFDDPTMPIVGPGETANDTYVEQLVASAKAAVDKAVEMGVADRDRDRRRRPQLRRVHDGEPARALGLFRAGIARSGAYNRTLTPFGFQNETRTFWEVPDMYAQDVAVLVRATRSRSRSC